LAEDKEQRPQRKHRRVATKEVTASIDIDGNVVAYTCVNLSIGGALVAGFPILDAGTVHKLVLKVRGTGAVSVRGQVVRSRPDGMGIAFETLSSNDASAMDKLIAAVEASQPQPPPLPPSRSKSGDDLPPIAPRPADNIFDTHDPRPPRSGAPDEREDYLRQLVKNRDEVIRKGRSALAALAVEADTLRAAVGRFRQRLESANAQHELTEVALVSARGEVEKVRAAQIAERAEAAEALEQEQRRTIEAQSAVSAIEAKMHSQQLDARRVLDEAEAARKEAQANAADVASLRKAREELLAANRKAMEAQAQLKRVSDAKAVADRELIEQTAEANALRAELSKLKAKLVAAENALERAAGKRAAGAK
jgi:hypothetical protein